eukprot:scaffold275000_cov22-Tisochrysis_lutea.AAC.1
MAAPDIQGLPCCHPASTAGMPAGRRGCEARPGSGHPHRAVSVQPAELRLLAASVCLLPSHVAVHSR